MPHSVICRRERCGRSYKQGSSAGTPYPETEGVEKTVPCRALAPVQGSNRRPCRNGETLLGRRRRVELVGAGRLQLAGYWRMAELRLGLAGELAHAVYGVQHFVVYSRELLLGTVGAAAGGNGGAVELTHEGNEVVGFLTEGAEGAFIREDRLCDTPDAGFHQNDAGESPADPL
jgi:hypothetical protein